LGEIPIWDAKHAEASQAAQDAELEKLLSELATSELSRTVSQHMLAVTLRLLF